MEDPTHILPIELLRRRPAMYVGSTDHHGIFVMLGEIYRYYANEVYCGAFNDLDITLHSDGSISVSGRGAHPGQQRDQIDAQTRSIQLLAEEYIHQPKTIDYRMGEHYIGITTVNGLSHWLNFDVKRGDTDYRFRWERGLCVSPSSPIDLIAGDELTIHWMPDPEIFGDARLSAIDVERFLTKMAPLLREATHRFDDQLTRRAPLSYQSERGLAHLVEYLNEPYTPVGQTIHCRTSQPDSNGDLTEIEFAVQFHREPGVAIISVANMRFTDAGGSHADGLAAGLKATMQATEVYDGDRDRTMFGPGYTATVSVRLRRPRFENSMGSHLGNDEIRDDVASVVHQTMMNQLAVDEQLRRTLQYT